MIGLLITLFIVLWVITLFPLQPPFLTVAQGVLVIILLLIVISYLLPFAGSPPLLR